MYASARQRTFSAIASLLILSGGTLALVLGLDRRPALPPAPGSLETIITTREIAEAPELPPPPPKEPDSSSASGAPSPPNLENEATPVSAPVQRIPPLTPPPPIIAAPTPAQGAAASTGSSDRVGAGQGAGGSGGGRGGAGSGAGAGGGERLERPATLPRQTKGRLRFSDLPRDLRRSREGAELTLRYRIGTDGRVSGCHILVSSGRPELDDHTCRYITEHFRFRPALDRQQRPVPYVMTETHGWNSVAG